MWWNSDRVVNLETIFSNLPVKMTSTNELMLVIKQNVLVILSQKQEIS